MEAIVVDVTVRQDCSGKIVKQLVKELVLPFFIAPIVRIDLICLFPNFHTT